MSGRERERERGEGDKLLHTFPSAQERQRLHVHSFAQRSPKTLSIPQIQSKATTKNQLLSNMDEGIPRLQDRQLLEHVDFIGLDYPSLYLCKPKRGMKRDESKETYKLPHRLIEKKRRDRINECIAQLKDLLPEHLKLTTLGHLEKAVVLELTLKHLKALTALTEQQHQNIIALQNGERSMKSPIQCDLDAFHSGFQTCAKEVLQYLSRFESWTPREQRCAQLVNHLHAVSTQFLPSPQLLTPQVPVSKGSSSSSSSCAQDRTGQKLEAQTNCVPVIQRTHPPVELGGENDTDTDSGYGGESEGRPDREKGQAAGLPGLTIKQEPAADEAPAPKRLRLDCSSSATLPAAAAAGLSPDHQAAAALLRPDAALLSSLMAFGGGAAAFGQPAAAAAAPFACPSTSSPPPRPRPTCSPCWTRATWRNICTRPPPPSLCSTPESRPRPPPPSPACPRGWRRLIKRTQPPPPPRPFCPLTWSPLGSTCPISSLPPARPGPAWTVTFPPRKIFCSPERKAPELGYRT
ncbi:unnamed protein product [Caretta caretta]